MLRIRTLAVCCEILQRRPAVVLLQEVVDSSARVLLQRLQQHYRFFFPEPPPAAAAAAAVASSIRTSSSSSSSTGETPAAAVMPGCPYYCAVLLCREQMLPPARNSLQTLWYPGSCMGRHLLYGCCSSSKRPDEPLLVLTSHLESMRPYAQQRREQLQHCFVLMGSVTAADPRGHQEHHQPLFDAFPLGKPQKVTTAILAGDLNLRDDELLKQQQQQQQNRWGRHKRTHREINNNSNNNSNCSHTIVPEGTVDAWEFLGRKPECMYTWDMLRNDNHNEIKRRYKPRCRFDRIYITADPPLPSSVFGAPDGPTGGAGGPLNPSSSSGEAQRAAGKPTWYPVSMSLVGTERLLSVGCFPSDHFGILCRFKRQEGAQGAP